MWDICGESFPSSTQLALHAETHVLEAISCPFQDCDQIFPTPSALVAHRNGHTEQTSVALTGTKSVMQRPLLLPSTRLNAPDAESLTTPPVPESVPTWEALSVVACMPGISKERHSTLGPWVLANICAPANGVRARARYNAALPHKFQPDYEFVQTSARHYSFMPSQPARVREMADLDSIKVSELLKKGEFVLWPPDAWSERDDEERSISSTVVGKDPEVLEKTWEQESASTDGNRRQLPVQELKTADETLHSPPALGLSEQTFSSGSSPPSPAIGEKMVVQSPPSHLGDKSDEEMAVENMLQADLYV
ncbi:hypothetical protein K438DRAFT_997593 [Mycena galopus ATCC 62051]|nr:hypothetical protein K438DRAFT_997593 [Mycena galopus ATCC 62051]